MINKSAIVKEAQKLIAKGQLDKAIAEYAKILKESPNDSNTHNTVGDLYLKKGEKENAIDSFKKAAEALNRDGFTLKAIALYKKVLNINPDQVDVMMLLGKLNAERGLVGNANESYIAAVSYFNKQGKKDKALDVYKILCNLNPDNINLNVKLAEMYLSEGFENEGISKFVDLAGKKAAENDMPGAKSLLERVKTKGFNRHDYIRVAALIDLKEDRVAEATERLEGLWELDRNDARVGTLLVDAYQRSGRYEDATGLLKGLIKQEPARHEYRKRLLDILIKSGDYSGAWEEYRHLIDKHIDKKEYDKAEKLLQEYIGHNSESIEARQVLSDLFSKIGREDKVKALHLEMAEIYARSGQKDKAANIYRERLNAEPDNEQIKAALERLESSVEAPAPAQAAAGEAPEAPQEGPATEEAAPGHELPSGISEEPEAEEKMPTELASEGLFGGPEEPGAAEEEVLPETPAESEEGGFPFEMEEEAAVGETRQEEGGVYEIPEDTGELPPFAMDYEAEGAAGGEGEETEEHADARTYELTDEGLGGMEDLGIFGTGEAAEEEAVQGTEGRPVYEIGEEEDISMYASEEPSVFPEAGSFEERLTEVDVYIKYGLFPKAKEALGSIEATRPKDPELQQRYMELCKAEGDVDGFVEHSLVLAGIYLSKDMTEEAEAVLSKAAELNPDDERAASMLGSLHAPEEVEEEAAQPGPGEEFVAEERVEETEEEEEEEEAPAAATAPDEFMGAGRLMQPEQDTGFAPGSVGYYEELAEADFYAQQGLLDEALAIYRKLLMAEPENDDIRGKYNDVLALKPEAPPVEEEQPREREPEPAMAATAPVEEPEPAARDVVEDELDQAFREMDFGQEEEEAGPSGEAAHDTGAEPQEQAAPQAEAEGPEPEPEEFFDLAAELRDEIGADILGPSKTAATFGDENLDAVFQEFKKGVQEQVGTEDYETHYNLGIAYKEMGMLDEAISEFTEAARDPGRSLDCASMLGLCYIEKGEYKAAVEQFRRGLAVKGRAAEEYLGLKYDMATAYELMGEAALAHAAVREICEVDDEFRDVKKRLQRLNKSFVESGGAPEERKGQQEARPKKSKVSYL